MGEYRERLLEDKVSRQGAEIAKYEKAIEENNQVINAQRLEIQRLRKGTEDLIAEAHTSEVSSKDLRKLLIGAK